MIPARITLSRQAWMAVSKKIGNLVLSDSRLSIRAIVEAIRVDKESVQQILRNGFGIQKICAQMMPTVLPFKQQEACKNICNATLNVIENDPNLCVYVWI
ncbi:FLJ37770-like protein [Trichonephila clavipes]|nr:FLJ37770-like protein [Trichonephila clavipes]